MLVRLSLGPNATVYYPKGIEECAPALAIGHHPWQEEIRGNQKITLRVLYGT
jgi:hypothetical protein